MRILVPVVGVLLAGLAVAQEEAVGKRAERSPLKSVGPLAFAPQTLLVSDRVAASIHAIALGQLSGGGLRADTEVAEGQLTETRARIVSRPPLAAAARRLDLATHLISGKGLRAGQFVTVFTETGESRSGIAVPRSAVVRATNGQDFVFEHTSAERFVPRAVRTEPLDAERVIVAAGLEPGRRVVVQGAELLDHVR